MALWKTDPTFYPSPRLAGEAPAEKVAFVTAFDPTGAQPDALAVIDVDAHSPRYGQVESLLEFPYTGDELHHFGWNACSSALCPTSPHPHLERRYLILPGLRSSRIYVVDTKPDPRSPKIVKVLEPEELGKRAGYSRPHTVHCGPEGLYLTAVGGFESDGPGGVALLDHESFDVRGRWEVDRGPQYFGYDAWWHINYDTLISSEWGTPSMIENGVVPELLLGKKYGHALHVWDLRRRRHQQVLELPDEYQMVLELRPAHDPSKAYGFVNAVVSVADLSASIWLWHLTDGEWQITKVIDIPAEPADASDLPPLLAGFGAVPPLVTDIDLSIDDRYLYVSAWGTGELRQYDVSDPFHPSLVGSVRIGGIVAKAAHPGAPDGTATNGGPQMVEVSRDGKRVYVTNSLYRAWDDQFYPEGIQPWMAKLDVAAGGGISVDPRFYPSGFNGRRTHQTRLEGGDASSDSYCFS
jgi:selenium-binding protein 1